MSLSVGIVGLPNVGKSTLFNALLKRQAALAANYPFATIEPNVGIVPVPDARLEKLALTVQSAEQMAGLPPIKPATVEFVDIAGLVRGASQGEGLGNQFLHHIRETDLICHVIRAFTDENVIREGSKAPAIDLQTVRMELQLADLATLEKQPEPKGKVANSDRDKWQAIVAFKQGLDNGQSARQVIQSAQLGHSTQLSVSSQVLETVAKELALLTAKTELFVVNVDESQLSTRVATLSEQFAGELGVETDLVMVMCNQIESELSSLADEDSQAYLAELGLQNSGLERLIQSAYQALGLQSFLTAGKKEVKAWTIQSGTAAQQAAGVIHTDFAKKMIAAKVAGHEDFIEFGGWKGLKENGKIRMEGRDYLMQEGDVVEFLIGG